MNNFVLIFSKLCRRSEQHSKYITEGRRALYKSLCSTTTLKNDLHVFATEKISSYCSRTRKMRNKTSKGSLSILHSTLYQGSEVPLMAKVTTVTSAHTVAACHLTVSISVCLIGLFLWLSESCLRKRKNNKGWSVV